MEEEVEFLIEVKVEPEEQNYKYEGDMKDGVPHGYGVMTLRSGAVIQGNFCNGLPHGYCIKFNSSGKKVYEGQVSNGYYHGKGIMFVNNGSFAEGLFRNGVFISGKNIFQSDDEILEIEVTRKQPKKLNDPKNFDWGVAVKRDREGNEKIVSYCEFHELATKSMKKRKIG